MVFQNNLLAGASGATGTAPFDTTLIGNSVWFDGSSDELTRSTTSHSSTECVMSCWFQLGTDSTGDIGLMSLGTGTGGSTNTGLWFSGNALYFYANGQGSVTTQLFRDIGWYHILGSWKLDESGTLKGRLFINGSEVTSFSDDRRTSWGTSFGSTATQSVGSIFTNIFLNGYMAQPVMLDGQSVQGGDVAITDFLDTFTFGTNGSQFVPKKDSEVAALASTAGGNSFCLDFANSGDLGNDVSGNNKDLSTSMGTDHQSSSTPSNTYAFWNPIQMPFPTTSGNLVAPTLTEGNLRAAFSSSNRGAAISSLTIPAGSGKYAAKFTINTVSGINPTIGVYDIEGTNAFINAFTATSDSIALRMDGQKYVDGSSSSYGSAVSAGNTVEIELDMDNNTVEFLINGSAQGTISKTFTGRVGFMIDDGTNTGAIDVTAEFDYTPDDSSFKTLNTANLTAPDYQGIDYFDATLYEGNGTGQRVGDFVPFTDLYAVDNSIIFDSGTKNHLQRTMSAAASNSNKQFTISVWVKRVDPTQSIDLILLESTNSDGGSAAGLRLDSGASDQRFQLYAQGSGVSSPSSIGVFATQGIRGTGAWHHFLCQVDTTQSTESNRVKLYIDGVLQEVDNGSGGSAVYPDQDATFYIGDDEFAHQIGKLPYNTFFNSMYIAEHAFVTGTNSTGKTISDYGAVDTSTNRWIPKDISGFTFGHNGHYLEFQTTPGSGNGAGTDTSGNSNHFAEAINGSASAWSSYTKYQTIDTPSKNFATIDPVISNGATPVTLSEGNLTGVRSASGFQHAYSSFSGFRLQENTGIYFAEVLMGADSSNFSVGVLSGDPPSSTNRYLGQDSNTYGYAYDSGNKVNNGTGSSYGATYTSGDVIGIEIDTDTGSINFHKNGADQGQAFTAVPGPYSFAFDTESGGGPNTFNFGQQMVLGGASTTLNAAAGGRFKHTPPTGAKALNQDNLDDTASKITAWAWIKNRDAEDNHSLFDRVRGVSKLKNIIAGDNTAPAAESTDANSVQRFLQRGVQIGSSSAINTANNSYVLWQWLVGDSATTGTVLSNGSDIDATVITADAGHFSVGTYTGTGSPSNFLHGLGGKPEFVAIFERGDAQPISTCSEYYSGSDYYMYLSYADGESNSSGTTLWPSDRTATAVPIGTNGTVNSSGDNYAFFAFRSIPGVCKVGNYEGNNSGDGTYVSLGFTPAWFMAKNVDASGGWFIIDNKRGFNSASNETYLQANVNDTETVGNVADLLSDGIKWRTTGGGNASNTFFYLAMADIGGNGTLPPIYGR